MKSALIGILQQRMDKCTTEQFWAVGAITGFNAFLLTQASLIKGVLPVWVVIATDAALAVYGLYFIISRHMGYFLIYNQLVELTRNVPEAPKLFKTCQSPWKGLNLSGVVFYCSWVILATAAAMFVYW